jgi:NACalpha-BTF3-like transcription factor
MMAADVEWDEALGALREKKGNVVEAIEALKR